MRTVLAIAALAWLAGCGTAGEATPADKPASAVHAFFRAVDEGDCEALAGVVAGDMARRLDEHGCAAVISDFRSHGVEVVSVGAARPDGRDPGARLLDAVVRMNGADKDVLIRVVQVGARWRLSVL